MKLLLTGFGPFGDITENPSAILVQNSGLPFEVLEVSFDAVEHWLSSNSAQNFDALLHLGVNARAQKMHLERVGRNQIGKTADAAGVSRQGLIDPTGPKLIRATIWPRQPIRLDEVRNSLSAGSYLCNYLLYRSLQTFPNKRVGFLHIPPFKHLSQSDQQEKLRVLIERISK